jgi:imidazolonepropionase-like amidohydrolase
MTLARIVFAIAAMSVLVAAQPSPPDGQSAISFTHVTVIDPIDGRARADMTVVVEGGRIAAVVPSAGTTPKGVVIDGTGKFVIPGLWDMHVHALTDRRYEWTFPMMLANGVTGIRDLGSNLTFEEIRDLRQRVGDGQLAGPRLAAVTGRVFDGAGTRLNIAVAVTTADQGRDLVREYKRSGADFIKPYNLLSREVYLAIVDEAKLQKLPVAGHVPFSMTATRVSELGVASIEHNTDVLMAVSRDEAQLRQEIAEATKTETEGVLGRFDARAAASYDEQKAAGVYRQFRQAGTWMCPTLVINRPINLIADETVLLGDERLKYVPAAMRERWTRDFRQRLTFVPDPVARRLRYSTRARMVGDMQRANVSMMAGTDAPNPFVYPGFSLHDELALLVEAGLTPLQALQTATINPARFLGQEALFGTIAAGKMADFVLLESDPLRDIRATSRINGVVTSGRWYTRDRLSTLLADAETAAKRVSP